MAKFPKDFRWKVVRPSLGEGKQGLVSVVEDQSGEYEGHFALKRLRSDATHASYERFGREVDALKAIDHPAIVKVLDHSAPNANFAYYVMELVPNAKPIKKLFVSPAANPFYGNAVATLSFLEQLLDALRACAEKSIVHRDLSPSNVLISSDSKVHLIDFGLCVVDDPLSSHSLTGDAGAGTQNYMAPECEAGAVGNATSASDLYSAGKLVWSVLTGRSVFAREAPAFTTHSMVKMFGDLKELWHFHRIFEKTIRKERADRWTDHAVAIEAVRNLRWVIQSGYPPLEIASQTCFNCGSHSIQQNGRGWTIFHNPLPNDYEAYTCGKCGITFVRDYTATRKELARRRELN